ncbi:amidohydrolase family protein [Mucilaginibacter sp. ZT4R22]|uniref:Amidohydrolase family protein n=1 Tax=Mucilaginibacter pankratovii TaxID=2772110 RepID=A0ABR7WKP1_9SPHI|nr:amidohydrolase family protein [Mucilaginibacter pankratovii]MBD1362888.1 amidohydrolase family protein [Mucilaginibacter pankratovii]
MQKIDAHQHFWKFDPLRDAWITDDMAVIQRDFFPAHLAPVLAENAIDGCIAVQADQSEAQNSFLMELAANNSFIKGVVGWVDLQADNLDERLQYYKQHSIIKGFRHVLQAEAGEFMLTEKFTRGISQLHQYGFTYDVLIKHDQLSYAEKLVAAFPQQKFVIDHLAKPAIKAQETAPWAQQIAAIAQHKNVYCKISGFCTEADWDNWQPADIKPYLDVVFDAFGTDRLMFGSDWPVSLLAGGYNKTVECLTAYLASFSPADQEKFWGGNAAAFYNL